MNSLFRTSQTVALVAGALALGACSSSPSSSTSGQAAQTTAAKVETARADADARLADAAQLVTEMREKVPDRVAARTKCVVAFPSMVKGGLVVGGAGGKGYTTCLHRNGWSAPAPISIGGGTIGAQIGVQSVELLSLVTSDKGMRALESGNFRVGVDASATAGPVGTGRGTSTDIPEGSDIVSYSRSKGLFAGAELNGSVIKADDDAIFALYGSKYDLPTLLSGRVAPPNTPSSQRFLSAVNQGFGGGRAVSESETESSVAP